MSATASLLELRVGEPLLFLPFTAEGAFSEALTVGQRPRSRFTDRAEDLDSRIADLYVVSAAAQFLETDVAFSGAGLDGRRGLAVVSLDHLVLFIKIQVVDQLAIEYDTQVRTLECNFIMIFTSL